MFMSLHVHLKALVTLDEESQTQNYAWATLRRNYVCGPQIKMKKALWAALRRPKSRDAA